MPLEQHFIGVKEKPGSAASNRNLNRACWDKVLHLFKHNSLPNIRLQLLFLRKFKVIELIREGRQVMVFVHSRKDTVKTANSIRELAIAEGVSGMVLAQMISSGKVIRHS